MSRDIDKEIIIYPVIKKWNRVIHIESYSFTHTNSGEILIINFLGYEIDFFPPDELLNLLALMHNEIKEVLGTDTEIKYLKSFPLIDSID